MKFHTWGERLEEPRRDIIARMMRKQDYLFVPSVLSLVLVYIIPFSLPHETSSTFPLNTCEKYALVLNP